MDSKEKKIYHRIYMRKWREKNKENYKSNNIKYQNKYKEKYPERIKLTQKKYDKKKIFCQICACKIHPRIKKQHFNTKKHKKNILKFNNLLKNFKFNKKKTVL